MKQVKMLSYLLFLSFFVFPMVRADEPSQPDYCYSGVDTCKCGKPKPPGYYSTSSTQAQAASDNIQSYSEASGYSAMTTQSQTAYDYTQSYSETPGYSAKTTQVQTTYDNIQSYSEAPGYSAQALQGQTAYDNTQSYSTSAYSAKAAQAPTAFNNEQYYSETSAYSPKAEQKPKGSDNKRSYSEVVRKGKTASNEISAASEKTTNVYEQSKLSTETKNDKSVNSANGSGTVNKSVGNSGTMNKSANGKSENSTGTAVSSNSTAVKGCKYGPTCEFNTGVNVRVKNPQNCLLGQPYTVEYEVLATSDVRDVVLTAEISENTSYVSSEPDTKINGKKLTWNLGEMKKSQKVSGKIVLKTEKEGDLCTCFNVRAAAGACCSTLCGKATLSCECSGPGEVLPGEQFSYSVIVANTGTYPAQDVILAIADNDQVIKPFNFKLGTIEPGKSKKTTIPVTAQKRGKIAYTAVATSSTADQVSRDLSTLVTGYAIECGKNGPKDALIGQKAPYQITVNNTGDRDLHDFVITETIHPATTIVAAEGASIADRKAVWKVPVLKAGEKAEFEVVLTTRAKGNYTNTTTVANREAYNTSRDTNTNWKGYAALDMSMNTSENAIFVGETTQYKINVTNKGHETDSNVTVAAVFPEGLEPVSATGSTEAKINGQTVNFAPKNLAPRQSLELYVTVKATKQGDLRPKVHLSSDAIKLPITQEESLIAY